MKLFLKLKVYGWKNRELQLTATVSKKLMCIISTITIGYSYSPMFSLCPGARLAQAQAHLPPLHKLPQSSGIQGDKSALAPALAPPRPRQAPGSNIRYYIQHLHPTLQHITPWTPGSSSFGLM